MYQGLLTWVVCLRCVERKYEFSCVQLCNTKTNSSFLSRDQKDLTVTLVIGIYHQLITFHHLLKEQVRLVEEDYVIGVSEEVNSHLIQQIPKICSKTVDVSFKTLLNGEALQIFQVRSVEVTVYQQHRQHQCHR